MNLTPLVFRLWVAPIGTICTVFKNYARQLAPIDKGDDTGMVIDLLSGTREYYNINTPASEMNLYNRLNSRKVSFPMYVEVVGTQG